MLLNPLTLTVDDIWAAAARHGVRIRTGIGWLRRYSPTEVCCCPLIALAIDTDPAILKGRGSITLRPGWLFSWTTEGWAKSLVAGFEAARKKAFHDPAGYALGKACRDRALREVVA